MTISLFRFLRKKLPLYSLLLKRISFCPCLFKMDIWHFLNINLVYFHYHPFLIISSTLMYSKLSWIEFVSCRSRCTAFRINQYNFETILVSTFFVSPFLVLSLEKGCKKLPIFFFVLLLAEKPQDSRVLTKSIEKNMSLFLLENEIEPFFFHNIILFSLFNVIILSSISFVVFCCLSRLTRKVTVSVYFLFF